MHVISTLLPGVVIVEPKVFHDARGFFLESYRADHYAEAGLPGRFVQDNHSCSMPGTIRGLHYQFRHAQGKLIRAIRGLIWDVAVDLRPGSATFTRWVGVELSAENKRQLYIPPGFAHGFCVPTEPAEVEYKCTEYYAPADERGVRWNDPALGISWPVVNPIVSEKDRALPCLNQQPDLPVYEALAL